MGDQPAIQQPTAAQIAAADPEVWAWVGANAGSGKTRVLAQRVARLLLGGAEPERILCLTYTKAAAAEMQNRLFAMLGSWAMADDGWLGRELAAIQGHGAPLADGVVLSEARRLFARALETPGGLKIQTIHAFCDALLRRFPLEARVSPRFEVIDERQSALMIDAIRTEMALVAEAGGSEGFDRVVGRLNEGALDDLIASVLAARGGFSGGDLDGRLGAHFDAALRAGAEHAARRALEGVSWDQLAAFAEWLRDGGVNDRRAAEAMTRGQALCADDPVGAATVLASGFTTQSGERRSRKGFPTKPVLGLHPEASSLTDLMIEWSMEALAALKGAAAVERARDLSLFATELLSRYAQAKRSRALLDFDDLVSRAAELLTRSDMAAWALYRLDQGIDHILVDEAQDTAPGQWAVIRAIAREFHAGVGARDVNRTLFVVGDVKQSIYSFQGAEPAAFGVNRDHFADWLAGMDMAMVQPDLITSFRSAPGILAYVDAVFSGPAGAALTAAGGAIEHHADRERDASRIDLWPLVETDPKEDPPPWWTPVDLPAPGHAKQRLARMLAAEIARMIRDERLPAREGVPGRRVRAGDILVLVQHRDALAEGLIRALKAEGLSVAGADRLTLTGELAVKDLMALIKVAVTPSDDLSLAALLRSPICGVSEEALFELAHGREGTLWQAVTAPESLCPEVGEMLRDMAGQADFLRPYEFLDRALIRHDGRRSLLARLGHEAEDPIDELLVQALVYESREAPTLAAFVAWIEAGDIQVKREMEQGSGDIRVMTVHGAKGLEAPVVILPDTLYRGGRGARPALFPAAGGEDVPPLMLWGRAKALDDDVTARARAEADRREADERWRLLYVALTRAEDWLILCGAGSKPDHWYAALAEGMGRLGLDRPAGGPAGLAGPIRRVEYQPVPVTGPAQPDALEGAETPVTRPGWLAPALREERVQRMSPATIFPHEEAGGAGRGRDVSLQRGAAVHLLLERLPDVSEPDLAVLGRRLLDQAFPELDASVSGEAIEEALAVLRAPFAGEVFGADALAEVSVALDLPDISPALRLGRIDRLLVTRDRVLVVDFKTDARPPSDPRAVPRAYLAQLACYREAISAIYPQHSVEAAILWTAVPNLMPLDQADLQASLADIASPAP
ncbi:MAG: double-strand break repair helicase AddA [Paracoccaceae bacterium]|nr:double-strand break repair helicase AddA [Paracoccaceae bacterium]